MGSSTDTAAFTLLSVVMGILGGLMAIPFNAIVSWYLKRDELDHQSRLERINKERELLLQHKLQSSGSGQMTTEIQQLKTAVTFFQEKFYKLEGEVIPELNQKLHSVNENIYRQGIIITQLRDDQLKRKP
jgi:predicted nuclease with TOPRIM domain